MSNDTISAHREVRIITEYGLHLRPADLFVRTAAGFLSEISVSKNGHAVNGKSILDLATLAAECGTVLLIHAVGPDAPQAIEALCRLVESNFDPATANSSSKAI